jgi:hypothetical protein
MASTRYQYAPLSSDFAFRLLRLKQPAHSENSTETSEIELFEASLADPPPFEAVSYAWDHADAHAVLICNDQQLNVSPAIVDIVSALSRISSTGVLWIDAVCIDQSSILDKNIQVPCMRNIYSEARSVWIWLGRESYEVRHAFHFLAEITGLSRDECNLSLREYQGEWTQLSLQATCD